MNHPASTSSFQTTWLAFSQGQQIAQGHPLDAAAQIKTFADAHPERAVLILEADTARTVELDLRGSVATMLQRLQGAYAQTAMAEVPAADQTLADLSPDEASADGAPRGPGRPKLGVVGREVTLLPRHWDWLATQPGGTSVALRKMVERAKKESAVADHKREVTEAAYRCMNLLASSEPGFEEASRALFAGDLARLQAEVAPWPADVRALVLHMARK
jgi:uncharacterized protein